MHCIFSLPQKAIGTHWLCNLDINHLCAGNAETNSREKTNRNRRKQKRSSQLSTHPSPIIYACPVLGHSYLSQLYWANLTCFQDITCMIWWHPHTRYKSTPHIEHVSYYYYYYYKVTTNKACTLMGTTGILLHEPQVHQHGRVSALCKTYVAYTSNAQLIHCFTPS